MKKKTYTLDQKTVDIVRHILTARIDNSTRMSQRMAYHCARDVFEYALAGNIEVLTQFTFKVLSTEPKMKRQNAPSGKERGQKKIFGTRRWRSIRLTPITISTHCLMMAQI